MPLMLFCIRTSIRSQASFVDTVSSKAPRWRDI